MNSQQPNCLLALILFLLVFVSSESREPSSDDGNGVNSDQEQKNQTNLTFAEEDATALYPRKDDPCKHCNSNSR